MAERFKVKQETQLLEFLFASLHGWSKKKIKQRLQSASVAINGTVTTQFNAPLVIDDIVEVGVIVKHSSLASLNTLTILYQDKDIIAIDKPAGLLSVGTTQETKQHALTILRNQLSKGRKKIQLFPVHRLDRDTSGILLFATSKETREAIMSKWASSKKIYLAIVQGQPTKEHDTIDQGLRLDDKIYKMHVGDHPHAKPAITHYQVKEKKESTSLLEVSIETGRQHQIRAHMSWLGHAVVGDERYGTDKNYKKGDRMGLHAYKLTIYHPRKKKFISFETDAPREFYQLLK